MGTRSITRVLDESNNVILTMYRQMDGYLEGHGVELVKFLKDFKITNGIETNVAAKTANGVGCLAAQLVGHFKTGVGGIYLVPTSAEEEEYNYTIRVLDEMVTLTYTRGDESGTLLPVNADKIDNFQQVVEFLYPDKYFENQWRKILVISRDDRYITGFDLKNNNQVKRFLLEKVFGGEDKVFASSK